MAVIFTTTSSSAISGQNPLIGKYQDPIKAIIRHESDVCTKNDDIVKTMFNIQKSKRYGESYVYQNEFDVFVPTAEGGDISGNKVDYQAVLDKFIKHTQFTAQFRITRTMMEDSLVNQMRAKAENFTRSYYKTRNKFATDLYVGATAAKVTFKGTEFDTTCSDGKPLFHKGHTYGGSNVQSNRFIYSLSTGEKIDTALVENAISAAVETIRNMKDENGYSLGYTADTIMISGNDMLLEKALKKILGSEFSSNASGALSGSVNLHFGNWTLVINPFWQRTVTGSHPMIVSSSEARKNLQGAEFIDRVPLEVFDSVDDGTLDYIWNGRSRFSLGFPTYKFGMMLDMVDYDATASNMKDMTGTAVATATGSSGTATALTL